MIYLTKQNDMLLILDNLTLYLLSLNLVFRYVVVLIVVWPELKSKDKYKLWNMKLLEEEVC